MATRHATNLRFSKSRSTPYSHGLTILTCAYLVLNYLDWQSTIIALNIGGLYESNPWQAPIILTQTGMLLKLLVVPLLVLLCIVGLCWLADDIAQTHHWFAWVPWVTIGGLVCYVAHTVAINLILILQVLLGIP